MRIRPSTLLALPTAAIALILLAGCGPADVEAPPTSSASPSATIDPTPTPTPTATGEEGVPVEVGCNQLVTPQELYDYNPNFALESGFSPSPGSLAAQAVAAKGIACSWVNLTSGETIVMSVAHLSDGALTARANDLITSSNSVPTYSVEGYFILEGNIGTAQAISPPYWITATSKFFFEPGDVAPLMAAALSALG
ncbi:MAG: iron ABC transporter ATP-binding protein [Rhodoglobus sp.]